MTIKTYTVEVTYLVPHYKHVTVEAGSMKGACDQALDDGNYANEKIDMESAHEEYITGLWEGGKAYPNDSKFPRQRWPGYP